MIDAGLILTGVFASLGGLVYFLWPKLPANHSVLEDAPGSHKNTQEATLTAYPVVERVISAVGYLLWLISLLLIYDTISKGVYNTDTVLTKTCIILCMIYRYGIIFMFERIAMDGHDTFWGRLRAVLLQQLILTSLMLSVGAVIALVVVFNVKLSFDDVYYDVLLTICTFAAALRRLCVSVGAAAVTAPVVALLSALKAASPKFAPPSFMRKAVIIHAIRARGASETADAALDAAREAVSKADNKVSFHVRGLYWGSNLAWQKTRLVHASHTAHVASTRYRTAMESLALINCDSDGSLLSANDEFGSRSPSPRKAIVKGLLAVFLYSGAFVGSLYSIVVIILSIIISYFRPQYSLAAKLLVLLSKEESPFSATLSFVFSGTAGLFVLGIYGRCSSNALIASSPTYRLTHSSTDLRRVGSLLTMLAPGLALSAWFSGAKVSSEVAATAGAAGGGVILCTIVFACLVAFQKVSLADENEIIRASCRQHGGIDWF